MPTYLQSFITIAVARLTVFPYRCSAYKHLSIITNKDETRFYRDKVNSRLSAAAMVDTICSRLLVTLTFQLKIATPIRPTPHVHNLPFKSERFMVFRF